MGRAGPGHRRALLPLGRADRAGRLSERPWAELLKVAGEHGKEQGALVSEAAEARAEEVGEGREAARMKREGTEAAKRADRRARTAAIDLALGLVADWYADVLAVAEGRPDLARNVDRREALEADAEAVDPASLRRAAELAMQTRRRLQVNVNEDLALDALFHRASRLLGESSPCALKRLGAMLFKRPGVAAGPPILSCR